MGNILIITGGPVNESFAREYISAHSWDHIIAADKGLNLCHSCQLEPDLILGDFDSSDQHVFQYYESKYPDRIRRYPAKKDETDTELALIAALSIPEKEIHILGALGGRVDHMLANIQLLQVALEQNRLCYLIDETTRIHMTDHPITLRKDPDAKDLVSLLAYGADVTGLTLEGFAYETKDLTLSVAGSRGISNYLTCKEGKISFTSGILLVIETMEY